MWVKNTLKLRESTIYNFSSILARTPIVADARYALEITRQKLQQIPACGHTFHMDCINHWFAKHTTCPLCRISLDSSAKAPDDRPDILAESTHEAQVTGSSEETPLQDHLDGEMSQELAEPTCAE
ncbi:Zinc finger, RING-H2-type [Dillenia turbinata]|uniref:Zinc finger, RING-H2-type n=1 Tax=Dillenia turbinata TaxID=194707 RepID=A0AAN8ZGM9_9MAGN